MSRTKPLPPNSILILGFTLLFSNFSFAQKALDSLLSISKNQEGTELVQTFNELSWEYKNRNADTSLIYAKWSLRESEKTKDPKNIASSFNSIANSYEALGSLDSARVYHGKSLNIKIEINDSLGIADSYNNLGIIYDESGQYDKALEHYFKALKIYETIPTNFIKIPTALGNIGIVYKKQKEYGKALSFYERALAIYEENNYDFGKVLTKGNIGSLLLQKKDYEESIRYSTEAKELYQDLGYFRYVPYMVVNRAVAQDSLKRHEKAKIDYTAAIEQFRKDNNIYELTSALIGFGTNQISRNESSKMLSTLKEALQLSLENEFKEFEVNSYKALAKAHNKLGDNSKAFEYQKKYAEGKDTLFAEEKTKTIFELEAKYQTEKKEREILEQRALIAEKELEVEQKNIMLFGSLALAMILGLIGYLFYNQQKLKNRQLKKESELKAALARIETQNKLQEQRLRISRDLHDNIGSQLTFIISSLDNLKYGFKDMNVKLADKLSGISGFTSQTIYELRDTIWAMNKNSITFEDLQVRISNFIEKAKLASTQTSFSFSIASEVDNDYVFSSVKGMNIYRIIQESVNNALKYAEASTVSVNLSEENNKLIIEIKDDGLGFNLDQITEGNGMNNMNKRASDINADLDIKSNIGKGTVVTLLIQKK